MKYTTAGILLFATLASGCASLPSTIADDGNGHQVEYSLTRHGGEVVVFENGLGGTMEWWKKVFPEVSKNNSAFAYNRPGYGRSAAASTRRDGDHVVEELRALLRSKRLEPPYVLVGHSVGGLYMQLFARRYPGEVSALILVDSTHPEQLKGAGAPEHWPGWVRLVFGLTTSKVAKEEVDAINAPGEEVLSLPLFAGKPVIVLSALQPLEATSPLADDANEKRREIARLHPGSKQVWVDCGHGIPLEAPESVIGAIREVLPPQ